MLLWVQAGADDGGADEGDDDGGGWEVVQSKSVKKDLQMVRDRQIDLVLQEQASRKGGQSSEGDPQLIKRDAYRRMLIFELPSVLVIHLKRFSHSKRGRLLKIDTHVQFDERVSFPEFCLQKTGGAAAGGAGAGAGANGEGPFAAPSSEYVLYGVVVHKGRINSGHYVAYVRGYGTTPAECATATGAQLWYYVSDSHVELARVEDVYKSQAYMLFYHRA